MVVSRPPMGWNSWNTFGDKINEELIMETADAMTRENLAECGYNYLVIDDCWSERQRDSDGHLVPDHIKFPHGMKYVSDYVHSKGLKFGMYSCSGTMTCGGFPGSYQHEFDDAKQFAEWGVDYLKYDYCYRDMTKPSDLLYRTMGMALANSGRDILFSACSWGADGTNEWIKTTGAHMWRSTGDISDTWGSIVNLTRQQDQFFKTNGHGCFNDMDMLVVGMNGKGNVADGSVLTYNEYKTHFSIWAMYSSPLILGCDVRNMTEETKRIVTNREVIAINQDPLASQPFFAKFTRGEVIVAFRMLDGGDLALGIFNFSDSETYPWTGYITLAEIGLSRESGKTLHLRELWSGEESDVTGEMMRYEGIAAHDCRLYRCRIVDAK